MLLLSFFLYTQRLEGLEPDTAMHDPHQCLLLAPLRCCNPPFAPLASRWLFFLRCFLVPAPAAAGWLFPEDCSIPPGFLPDIWLLIWRSGYGWQGWRLTLFLLHPSSKGPSIPLFMSGNFAG